MNFKSILRSKGLVCGVLAAFVLFMTPAGALAKAPAAPGGSLTGFIYAKDMKTPVAGAVVKIRNLEDQKDLASAPADANGMYKIVGIPEGSYLLGVTSAEGDYDFDYSLRIKSNEMGKLSVALAPGAGEQSAGGDAPKKKGFFRSWVGRALIVSAIGVGVYLVFFTEKEASPIR